MNANFNDYFFYHIYPLGFCGAPKINDISAKPVKRLLKITNWIEHIKNLGVNAVYLGPVFESDKHGYDTIDYYNVDRRLGSNETLKEVTASFHKNGIKVILDGVFNHVSRKFPAFEDLLERNSDSSYKDWFTKIDFSKTSPFNDSFSYEGWDNHFELVKLNLKNDKVKQHLFNAVKMWIEEFGIDGLRLDAADCIDFSFLDELSRFTKNINPDFFLVGEVIHGDYNKWANTQMLDSVTNYECYKGLYSSHNDINYFEIAYSLNRQFGADGIYKNIPLYNFTDNHDVSRIATQLKNITHIYPLHVILFAMPGIPSIYYGSEFGVKGKKFNKSDDELRPAFELSQLYDKHGQDLLNVIRKLAAIRNSSQALKYGNYTQLYINHQQFAFMRNTKDETAIIAVNSSPAQMTLEIEVPFQNGTCYYDVLNPSEKFTISQNKLYINELHSNWGRILLKC